MNKLTDDSIIKFRTGEITVAQMIETLIYLPVQQMIVFFANIELKFARDVRIRALKSSMDEKVISIRQERSHLGDELSHRLEKYQDYTETQLENLLVIFDDGKIDEIFFKAFWLNIITYMVEKKVKPKAFSDLLDLSINHQRKNGSNLPNMIEYNKAITEIFFDEYFTLDGLESDTLRKVLSNSSTLEEIKTIGLKYNVVVPRRLKKTEFVNIVINELKNRGDHTGELETKIRNMPVRDIIRFNVNNNIKAAIDLKVEDMIEYVLLNAKKTKEEAFIPGAKELRSINSLDNIAKYLFSAAAIVFMLGVFISSIFIIFPKLFI